MKFKPGDKVIRTGPTGNGAVRGETYTVTSVGTDMLKVAEYPNGRYRSDRFVLAPEIETEMTTDGMYIILDTDFDHLAQERLHGGSSWVHWTYRQGRPIIVRDKPRPRYTCEEHIVFRNGLSIACFSKFDGDRGGDKKAAQEYADWLNSKEDES